ncbi:hypothetical protein BDZ89DRAFT_503361 [Hymenopellis radicata]|nr:hypothetical protein BDZ89DRAFT_503361 [Hymenopellis radicata]
MSAFLRRAELAHGLGMIDSLDALAQWTLCAETGCPCPNHGIPQLALTDFEALSDAPTFNHLSRTNDIASALEESIIRGVIADLKVCHEQTTACSLTLRAFRVKLMAQVVRVDEQLKVLTQERLRIAQARQKRKRLLHPARRLPNEILAQIFSFCVDFPIPRTFREWAGSYKWWHFDIHGL